MEVLENLGLNQTFYIQIINFILLFIVLYKLLFKSFLNNLKSRKKTIEKGIELKKTFEKKIASIDLIEQREKKKAQKKIEEIFIQTKENANKEAKEIIDKAYTEKDKLLKNFQAEMNMEKEKNKEKLHELVKTTTTSVLHDFLEENPNYKEELNSKILRELEQPII